MIRNPNLQQALCHYDDVTEKLRACHIVTDFNRFWWIRLCSADHVWDLSRNFMGKCLLYFWERFVHGEEDTIGQDCQNDDQVEILIYWDEDRCSSDLKTKTTEEHKMMISVKSYNVPGREEKKRRGSWEPMKKQFFKPWWDSTECLESSGKLIFWNITSPELRAHLFICPGTEVIDGQTKELLGKYFKL